MATIKKITWQDIEVAIRSTLAIWSPPDVIVGVSRGGVPITIAMSCAAPNVPVGFVYRLAARGNSPAFYIFHDDRLARDERHDAELRLSTLPGSPKRILVVDDVVTHGGTLEVVRRKVIEAHPQADVSFYCYAADRERLRSGRPHIESLTTSTIDIDNEKVWLNFPWQISL